MSIKPKESDYCVDLDGKCKFVQQRCPFNQFRPMAPKEFCYLALAGKAQMECLANGDSKSSKTHNNSKNPKNHNNNKVIKKAI